MPFMTEYCDQLANVQTPNDLVALRAWLNHGETALQASNAQDQLNRVLDIPNDQQLRSEHPLTVAIGGTKGILLLSANPGYNHTLNLAEINLRLTEQSNESFCAGFFEPEMRDHAMQIPWWRRAATFARDAHGAPAQHDAYDWAAASKGIGAIDLVPFHSAGDAITKQLVAGNARRAEVRLLRNQLQAIARATVDMALRLQPRVLLVASAAGAVLVRDQLSPEHHPAEDFPVPVVVHQHWTATFQFSHQTVGRTAVLSFPGQVFSARSGLGGMHAALAHAIHNAGLLNGGV